VPLIVLSPLPLPTFFFGSKQSLHGSPTILGPTVAVSGGNGVHAAEAVLLLAVTEVSVDVAGNRVVLVFVSVAVKRVVTVFVSD